MKGQKRPTLTRASRPQARVAHPVTLITVGKISRFKQSDGKVWRILLPDESVSLKGHELTCKEPLAHRKYLLPHGITIKTNGGVIRSQNDFGVVLEVVPLKEIQTRFPGVIPPLKTHTSKSRRPSVGAAAGSTYQWCCTVIDPQTGNARCDDSNCPAGCVLYSGPSWHKCICRANLQS
jgi:hypothetical protein